jgi:hypothetical protein
MTLLQPFKWFSSVPVGLLPSPLPTVPLCLRSMCQLSVSPALFFNVKANTAFPCLMASFLSASLEVRALLIASKPADEGNLSGVLQNELSSEGWKEKKCTETYRSSGSFWRLKSGGFVMEFYAKSKKGVLYNLFD